VDEIRNVLGARVIYVMQKEQLGTGHAVMAAKDWLTDFSGDVVVAVGDGP
ncbi:MAG: bifunctional UDP-N-acetylglucosamine diphosphorylase/glucosamine-1-phosphate N-acetyltransferase GlmU, partial [candidate division Zixibacteria bacterium]|nr:bifunctional UDP-N-acetylglucosamine diphosphorylase/glucosamine-1-phosphate N-acetyltransferase GlmU [candidate division Zixibacteria bacterium]NIW39610.1 bifunctional UDP-N-acetylglucosamine diphosphorylase/glucosamine-1-phosphate N-acetyltransferase GlmU [candidate division Zixibacteria bacterium]NIX58808.1 bifunctional UDP-N-acetylglucosamine diphosphorylase/glucosamine-1-phosphate N-acetyltransferase GlmU [candidate division Zixibacteria bacterium]